MRERFERAIAAIDAANADDPFTLTIDGKDFPKELTHAEMMTRWVLQLDPNASEELQLAARAHHIRRWMIPRTTFPAGRSAYLRWRRALHAVHAELTAAILEECGYSRNSVAPRPPHWSPKPICSSPAIPTPRHSRTLSPWSSSIPNWSRCSTTSTIASSGRALGRTWRKMSPSGQAAARRLALSDRAVETLNRLVDGFADD